MLSRESLKYISDASIIANLLQRDFGYDRKEVLERAEKWRKSLVSFYNTLKNESKNCHQILKSENKPCRLPTIRKGLICELCHYHKLDPSIAKTLYLPPGLHVYPDINGVYIEKRHHAAIVPARNTPGVYVCIGIVRGPAPYCHVDQEGFPKICAPSPEEKKIIHDMKLVVCD